MFTQHDFRVFERCLDRMVVATWIEKYSFTIGKGISIHWTPQGHRIARMLRELIVAYDLRSTPHQAKHFDHLCHDPMEQRPAKPDGLKPEIAEFWRECLAVLELNRHDFDFMCMVQIVDEFGPEAAERE